MRCSSRRRRSPALLQAFLRHDQFFATFGALGPAARNRWADMLAEVMRRAGAQNILYLELMVSPGMAEAAGLAQGLAWDDDLARMRSHLSDAALDAIAEGVGAYVTQVESGARALLGCATHTRPGLRRDRAIPGTALAGPAAGDTGVARATGLRPARARLPAGATGCARGRDQAIRVLPAPQVFAQLVLGFRLAQRDARVVGINLVAPEDDPVALADYTRHMRAVAFAAREAPDAGVALHAGELTLGLVPPEELRFHIREALEIAGADRIGHGTDVLYEDDPQGLLELMARRRVLVEINLTSSAVILGVEGRAHPFPVYRAAGVPTALSTDDEGVSRIDLTYRDIRALSRNSVEFAFLPTAERAALPDELDRRFAAFESGPVLAFQRLLAGASGASRNASR